MDERDGFVSRDSLEHVEPTADEVVLDCSGDTLRVELLASPFGMPRRWRRPPAVRLTRGDWVRWQINYRFATSSSGDWTYRLDTLNLAYGHVAPDAFLGPPTHFINKRAALR